VLETTACSSTQEGHPRSEPADPPRCGSPGSGVGENVLGVAWRPWRVMPVPTRETTHRCHLIASSSRSVGCGIATLWSENCISASPCHPWGMAAKQPMPLDSEMTSAEVARLTRIDAPRISRGELARYGLAPLRVHVGPHGYRRRFWPRAAVERLASDLARLRAQRDALQPRPQ
jgi:hypothetical protein